MEAKEMTEAFIDFEKKYEMFNLWINDCQIWAYIRFQVNAVLQQHMGLIDNTSTDDKKGKGIKKDFIDKLRELTIHNQFLTGHREVLIVSLSRKIMEDGHYKCVYTDLLDKTLKLSHYVLDKRNSADQFLPQNSRNVVYMDERSFFKKEKGESGQLDKKWIDEKIIKRIEQYFNVTLKYEERKKIFLFASYVLETRKKWMHYYMYMLKRIKPKVIIVICYYYWDILALCEVAKRMAIPVIELQHGIIGREHIAYNFPEQIKMKCIPDYLFAYGEFDKESMRFPIPKNNILPVGFPELEKQCQGAKEKKLDGKKNILFVSSAMPDIVIYANELAEKLDPEKNRVILKLHPMECNRWKKKFGKYITSKVLEIVDKEDANIYSYLQKADWVIGTMSTVLLEATLFEVKIAVIETSNSSAAKILYKNENAILVNSVEMLADSIDKDDFIPKGKLSIFEKDSLTKMIEGIDYVIERNNNVKKKR